MGQVSVRPILDYIDYLQDRLVKVLNKKLNLIMHGSVQSAHGVARAYENVTLLLLFGTISKKFDGVFFPYKKKL